MSGFGTIKIKNHGGSRPTTEDFWREEMIDRVKAHIDNTDFKQLNNTEGEDYGYPAYVAIPTRSSSQQAKVGTMANLEKLAGEIADMNYTDFTKGEDYASLAKRYSQQGQKAMDDTIGKVAARTGGMASSYATAAGNQAYNEHMSKLEDAARGLYDSQRQEKIDNLGISKSLYDINYQEERDTVADNRYVQGIQRENADIMQGRAQETIAMMLAAGMTMADIQKQYPDLVGNSGYDIGYWDSYEKQVNAPEVDTGSLSDTDKEIIAQYKWYVEEDMEVPIEIQERYKQIMGMPTIKATEYANKIANAITYAEALEYATLLFEIDENAANEALEAWEKAHPGYDKASDPDDWKNVMPEHRPTLIR